MKPFGVSTWRVDETVGCWGGPTAGVGIRGIWGKKKNKTENRSRFWMKVEMTPGLDKEKRRASPKPPPTACLMPRGFSDSVHFKRKLKKILQNENT